MLNLGLYLIIAVLTSTCATPPPEVKKTAPVEPVAYDLRAAEFIRHPQPLPNKSSIMVDWKLSNDEVVSSEGFRAWDMNHDGRFEMLEILSSSGHTTAWAYDFDGDGVVDLVQATPDAGVALLSGAAPIPGVDEASQLLKLSH